MGNKNHEKNEKEKIRDIESKLKSPPSSVEELLYLLDETKGLLDSMVQPSCRTMLPALQPVMAALATKGMLSHPNSDVRVAVTLCLCEVARISAPEPPYDDDTMKELFVRIVESFGKLRDLKSRSFPKRVSILETVARLRLCLVMLDLECDDLILEMFRHFLKQISRRHQKIIVSYMETIMTHIIEESEELSRELVLCLLESVRRERMVSASFKLAENVICRCSDKLQPLITELIGERGNEYSQLVAYLCYETSEDAMEQRAIEASAKNAPMENQMLERTVSNGETTTTPVVEGNGESIMEVPFSPKQKVECPRRVIKKTRKAKESKRRKELSGSQELLCDKPNAGGVASALGSELDWGSRRGRTCTAKKDARAQKEVLEMAGNSDVRKGAAAKVTISSKENAKSLGQQKDNVGDTSRLKRKRDPENERAGSQEEKKKEMVSGREKYKELDESIVGERIKVWWPLDKVFYSGTVEKYNCSDKMHTVTYDDGDIEVLSLKNEVWIFLEQEAQDTHAAESSKSQKSRASLMVKLKETPKRPRSTAKSKSNEPANTHKTATSSKNDAKSKEK